MADAVIGLMRSRRARGLLAAFLVTTIAFSAAVALAAGSMASRSSARAIAQAISLRPADLPMLIAEADPITAQDIRAEAEADKCDGRAPPSQAVARARSDLFVDNKTLPTELVFTETAIQPTAGSAARDYAAAEKPKTAACGLRLMLSALRATLATNETVTGSTEPLQTQATGTNGMFGVSIEIVAHLPQGAKLTIFDHVLSFIYRQAEVSLVLQTHTTPPPSGLERHLAGLLVARAHANIG